MARGRMIAKTLSTSERWARLHDVAGKLAEFCQSLYPLLIAHADDSGRQQGDAFTVKHAVHPTSPRGLADFERGLSALAAVNLIAWYEVDGRKYIEIQDFALHQPGLKNRGNSKIPAMPDDAVGCREMPLEGKGTEEKRTEEKGREGNGADAPPLAAVPTTRDPVAPECKVEAVVQLWNEMVAGSKLPQCRGLSDKRRGHIKARLKDHGLGIVRDTFGKAIASSFCNGHNDRAWVLTFDWLMESPDNFLKVMEGKFDNRHPPKAAPPGQQYIKPEEHMYGSYRQPKTGTEGQ